MVSMTSAETSLTTPAFVGDDDVTGVDGGAELHAGADQRRVALDERHGLTLHVGAHERTVCVVVLEERDQRRRDRHHLARRDVHVVDLVGGDLGDLAVALAHQDPLLDEPALASSAALACAMTARSSSSAVR